MLHVSLTSPTPLRVHKIYEDYFLVWIFFTKRRMWRASDSMFYPLTMCALQIVFMIMIIIISRSSRS